MKRLDHGRRGSAGPDERISESRRSFFKVAGAALLGGALALSPMSFLGRDAKATPSVMVNGTKVYKVTLTDSIRNLDRTSKASNGVASSVLNVPKKMLHVTIGLGTGVGRSITFSYPKGPTDSTRTLAGFKLDSFVSLVTRVSGEEPKSARLFYELETVKGEQVVNVYAIPLNAHGDVIGKYNGGQLAVGASYYPKTGKVYGGVTSLLYEPKTAVAVVSAED